MVRGAGVLIDRRRTRLAGWIARRLLTGVLTLVGITLITFALVRFSGDPLGDAQSQDRMNPLPPAAAERIRAIYHLDEPFHRQYALWLFDALQGDLGVSLKDRRPVSTKIGERMGTTLSLNLASLVLTLALAVPLGALAAARPGSRADRWTEIATYVLYALPVFWAAILLQRLFSVELDWLPLAGLRTSGADEWSPVARGVDRARHLMLPVVCLSYGGVAFIARFVRSNLFEEIGGEARRAVLAQGHGALTVLRRGMRRAAIPLFTLAGFVLPALFAGSVLVEEIFGLPGLGRLFVEAARARDHPTILGLTLLTGGATLLGILMADLAYATFDPRVRRG